jgi:hypothetical protein
MSRIQRRDNTFLQDKEIKEQIRVINELLDNLGERIEELVTRIEIIEAELNP